MLALLARRFGAIDTLLVGIGLLLEVFVLGVWSRRFDPRETLRNYRGVMRLNTVSASALAAYLVGRLVLNSA
jgi:hypothetical protein